MAVISAGGFTVYDIQLRTRATQVFFSTMHAAHHRAVQVHDNCGGTLNNFSIRPVGDRRPPLMAQLTPFHSHACMQALVWYHSQICTIYVSSTSYCTVNDNTYCSIYGSIMLYQCVSIYGTKC